MGIEALYPEYSSSFDFGLSKSLGAGIATGQLRGLGAPFLATFGHQWEFGSDGDLVVLERFFDELVGLGAVFVEVREVSVLDS